MGQVQTSSLVGKLNGTLNEQYQDTGVSEYRTDLSSWINDRTLHGFEVGYQYFNETLYMDFSYSLFYRNENERTVEPYPLPISNVGRSYVQGLVGRSYQHEQSYFFAGVHLGISSTWLQVDPTYELHITLDDDQEEMLIQHNTFRTGFRIGAQSGVTQGIRVVGEYGIDISGNQDQKLFLGYFFTL